ncbi:MAG: ATP-binding cassette domain-containing protein [Nitrospinaceae bacterium]|nr:ABC transporter ATP-binding protein [Nitrospinaceae bacterium]NIR57009.1 ABC transporter ATP-binding protein [Nitrospinaceae bacterium]NIS87466.1 ABC transporter ATP-binding protein [Nitrospinaceae bacterium]NIT84315.1 ABC transporter ATP-binding protein [Nitrospinaceae bacterium]NIU46505.1 ABC transporter ATP-binding protein [Nitrospinaceae bacterium]
MDNAIIRLDRVTKVYRVGGEDFTALHEISLEIEAGAFLSFVGPSGSGKTTLLNLIGGLDRPTTGTVSFKDAQLGRMSRDQLAEYRKDNVGFVFQTYNLLPVYTVYENVLFPLLLAGVKEAKVRSRVRDLVDQVGLGPQAGKKPTELSGGQCQRVAIARALVKNPSLVLADEPTANLDSENSYQILELMDHLNRQFQAAFVFSTHDEKVTKYIHREIRVEDGRVCWDKRRNGAGVLE